MRRYCRFCGRVLVTFPHGDDQAKEHCESPNCHWCMDCDKAKREGAK